MAGQIGALLAAKQTEEPTMKNFRDEVNAVMAALSDAVIDAEKFDQGNESAGRLCAGLGCL